MATPRLVLAAVVALAAAVPLAGPAPASGSERLPTRRIAYHDWRTGAELARGHTDGVRVRRGHLVLGEPAGTSHGYEYGRWTSRWVRPRFDLTELVASWSATTPGDTWVQVRVRGRTAAGARSSWDTLAQWAADDTTVRRRSAGPQTDDLGRVAYDTWVADGGVAAWQLRVTLLRRTGTRATPDVDRVGAMVSRLPVVSSVPTSRPTGLAAGRVLDVPRFSQMVHEGEYPQFDGGGEAWCSPTSLAMVLGYYGALPRPSTYAWVDPSYTDRVVDHVARMTYDAHLGGTGNWPFNTAYADRLAGHAFVTRLRSLREAERFVAVGIPLVASVTFGPGELDGAPISSTGGHLLVISGFTADGDVVVDDPASSTRAGVRRVYDRGQLEDAWLRRSSSGGSGGLVYVVRDAAHPLPARDGHRNW